MISSVVNVKLKELLDKREMTIYKLAQETGISYNNLHRIATKKAKVMSFDVLEKICIALDCKPNDLFEIKS
jgi:putative transcriptional regulator